MVKFKKNNISKKMLSSGPNHGKIFIKKKSFQFMANVTYLIRESGASAHQIR